MDNDFIQLDDQRFLNNRRSKLGEFMKKVTKDCMEIYLHMSHIHHFLGIKLNEIISKQVHSLLSTKILVDFGECKSLLYNNQVETIIGLELWMYIRLQAGSNTSMLPYFLLHTVNKTPIWVFYYFSLFFHIIRARNFKEACLSLSCASLSFSSKY